MTKCQLTQLKSLLFTVENHPLLSLDESERTIESHEDVKLINECKGNLRSLISDLEDLYEWELANENKDKS